MEDEDNSTASATAMVYRPDARTFAERARDNRRHKRQRRRALLAWRLRGFLPRGWKDNHDDCC